jgi:hypothetical protein
MHASLVTHLIHSSTYHPQMDGQAKRVNHNLEDMLRAYVMEHPGSWDKNLSWAEFSYNNRYQESLKKTPFEVLYDVVPIHRSTGLSYGPPHTRQPKGRKVTPRELCKQEASTLRV